MDQTFDSDTRGRFGDMPAALTDWVREIPPDLAPPARYAMAAGFLVAHYLGSDRLDDRDPFLLGNKGPAWQAASRLVSVAEALFVLRREPGFPTLCARLRSRPLRSTFFDVSAARRFAEAGFSIRPLDAGDGLPVGFIAEKGAETIAVLSIALEARRFAAAAVRRALDEATAAPSGEGPAFLCCHYPPSWALDCWDLDFSLGEVARSFLRERSNVNQVGFYREVFAELEQGNAHYVSGFVERNPAPAVPSSALESVTAPPPPGDAGTTSPKFFEWVDWALARQG